MPYDGEIAAQSPQVPLSRARALSLSHSLTVSHSHSLSLSLSLSDGSVALQSLQSPQALRQRHTLAHADVCSSQALRQRRALARVHLQLRFRRRHPGMRP